MADEEKQAPPAEQQTRDQRPADEGEFRPLEARPFPARKGAEGSASDVRFTRASWKERAPIEFGVSPHAVAGALALHDPAEEISKSEVQQALDEFSVRQGV